MTAQPLVDTPALDLDTALALDLGTAPIFDLDATPIFDLDAGPVLELAAAPGLEAGQNWPQEGLLNPAGAIPQNDRETPGNRPGMGQR